MDPRSHGGRLRGDLASALQASDDIRDGAELDDEELQALGTILVLEAGDRAFPLALDSLESSTQHKQRRPRWQLLSVLPPTPTEPERAVVWVSDEYREKFLQIFEEYATRTTAKGNAPHQGLVANIGTIRTGILRDLWQSAEEPPETGQYWWELWLRPTGDEVDLIHQFAARVGLTMRATSLRLVDRVIVWANGTWTQLQSLPFTSVPLAELRRPEFADSVGELIPDEQQELTGDLVARVRYAGADAPAVCHLDTGVRRTHALLQGALGPTDVHSVVDSAGFDTRNHGTRMAGLALFGDLEEELTSSGPVVLEHRLESVKLFPDGVGHPAETYGVVTASAVALPEIVSSRARVFCMPVTAEPDRPGEPTLWSASVDALASGVDIDRDGDQLVLLGKPEHDAARLFVVSAGNVDPPFATDHVAVSDVSVVQDPAQAWNALTVGAHTDLVDVPRDPSFDGFEPLAPRGELSPHSRTSLVFPGRRWPLKPDICMEGGNVLSDGSIVQEFSHPSIALLTTDAGSDEELGTACATSAATAQASRLAAITMARYPQYWPETVRGLLVHAARWTPVMREALDAAASKTYRQQLLRRYGWGVPDEVGVLTSGTNAVTVVSQDEFQPFEGKEYRLNSFRLHSLPWPVDVLREIVAAGVTMRVTLSYFVEPTASRRGWRRRYSYASHGLRFELKTPLESASDFVIRVGNLAEDQDAGVDTDSMTSRWLIGPNQRNLGSLHQDVWEGTGPELADCGLLAVYPVGGWWKNNRRKDRQNTSVRYSLIVSLSTDETAIDLYTPIAAQLMIPVPGT